MRRPGIEFSGRQPFPYLGWSLLAIGLMGLATEAYVYRQNAIELARLEQQQAAAQLRVPVELPLSAEQALKQEAAIKQANQIIGKLAFPWDGLFQRIEASVGDDVRLLSIEPDIEGKTLRLTGEAKDLQTMLAYEQRLQDTPGFVRPHVVSHKLQPPEAMRRVGFSVVMGWDEGALGAASK